MNIVDSSGWLAYFADEPNADFMNLDKVNYLPKQVMKNTLAPSEPPGAGT